MRYVALATDFDGTLALHGRVAESTIDALRMVVNTGRRLLLVTGRELEDLRAVFAELELFDWLVVENGAVLHRPATGETRVLSAPPPPALVAELRRRNVTPLAVGEAIVATWEPNESVVLDVIRDLGLELQVIFNKGAVMVLPASANKATGTMEALKLSGLSPHNLVAIGDAENDHALLDLAECSAAVANAVPMLKQRADFVTKGSHGAGVEELIERLIENDLDEAGCRREERLLVLGTREDGSRVTLEPMGHNVLIAGSSGSGKSTLATSLLEQLTSHAYQCCVIDPEGDYGDLPEAIVLGSAKQAPERNAIASALEQPATTLVVNLLGVKLADRPQFSAGLLLVLQEMRARTGRPHWVLVDEAHHLLPSDWRPAPEIMAEGLHSMVFVTVHPEHLAPIVLAKVDVAAAVGDQPHARLEPVAEAWCAAVGPDEGAALQSGDALIWFRDGNEAPFEIHLQRGTIERQRHLRKYAEGELGEDRNFYYRGPHGRLNLRAQNLVLFVQIADGVDDETWQHHLRSGDYSQWIRESIKDEDLAAVVQAVEDDAERLDPRASRAAIRRAIEQRYTLPVSGLAPAEGRRLPKGRPAES
jgi:hydroxymethylpyrimidine pyrophosphatase-like HAD family hydrolase/energy-coupling factor transporter ATP-binding protein EcfA2